MGKLGKSLRIIRLSPLRNLSGGRDGLLPVGLFGGLVEAIRVIPRRRESCDVLHGELRQFESFDVSSKILGGSSADDGIMLAQKLFSQLFREKYLPPEPSIPSSGRECIFKCATIYRKCSAQLQWSEKLWAAGFRPDAEHQVDAVPRVVTGRTCPADSNHFGRILNGGELAKFFVDGAKTFRPHHVSIQANLIHQNRALCPHAPFKGGYRLFHSGNQ